METLIVRLEPAVERCFPYRLTRWDGNTTPTYRSDWRAIEPQEDREEAFFRWVKAGYDT